MPHCDITKGNLQSSHLNEQKSEKELNSVKVNEGEESFVNSTSNMEIWHKIFLRERKSC